MGEITFGKGEYIMEKITIGAMFVCMILAALCFAHAFVFGFMGEKSIWLVPSYRKLPKEKREAYSVEKICTGARNTLALWGLWFILGTVACYFLNPLIVLVFVGGWIAMLIPRMSFREKRYDKFRK
ncbi:hypothetical protein B5F37_05955 [Drancourtella sp. An210]|uniref:DUF3784 domain-containing protein n=2 Tax=Lachnospiraceae TaxID=186803 RepID=A0ABS7L4H4_9FIRM|nr:DUF3784 domain-containing protein [Sellimonas caecigallum]OUP01754.1 hypothetical protein B5F37_05955 [Drancourtella sp. An210]